jgi:translation initiation factor 1 (eIF-1/SUI1)
MIQKIEDNASSEELQKNITDKQNKEKALTIVEGLKVKETDGHNISNTLNTQDSYSFSFYIVHLE